MKNNLEKIFLSPPSLTGSELEKLQEALLSGYLAPTGPQLEAFENELVNKSKKQFAIALNSGTSALHLALKSIQLAKNEVVLCTTFTFAGSAFPIIYEGGIPYFIDSEIDNWNISPKLIKKAIVNCKTKGLKIKALIATDLYGMPCKWQEIKEICSENNIFIIQDAAEALRSSYFGEPNENQGDISILSFNGNKIITTSAGGALLTNSEEIALKVKYLASQAKENLPYYQHLEIGYNYRMSNILAAIGLSQISNLDERVTKKQTIFKRYVQNFSGYNIGFQNETENAISNRWLTCITFENENLVQKVHQVLKDQNIESRYLWKPMHLQPVFNNCLAEVDNTSENLFKKGLCIPSGLQLSNLQIDYISELIIKQL